MSKILLLEDDANLNDTITEFLEEQGYNVVNVYDGYIINKYLSFHDVTNTIAKTFFHLLYLFTRIK